MLPGVHARSRLVGCLHSVQEHEKLVPDQLLRSEWGMAMHAAILGIRRGIQIMNKVFFLMTVSVANVVLAAPVVVNGSLEGPIANSTVPTGWTITSFSPDTMDQNNNLGVIGLGDFGALPSPSPDGGTWVGLFTVGTTVEQFAQTVSGFAVGQAYEISWYHSNFGHAFSTNDVAIEVFIDGSSIGTGPTIPLGTDWFSESLTFTATANTHAIEFGSAGGLQAYNGIDGIKITAVPEPSAVSMMNAMVCGIWASARRRRR